MNESALRVLLIEDSPLQARLVRELLSEVRDASISCEWVDRLAKGLDRLARGGIDVVLLDLNLPDSWGMETLAAIRRRFPSVPVAVFMSGGEETRSGGAHGWISKDDLDAAALEGALRSAVARAGSGGASSPR